MINIMFAKKPRFDSKGRNGFIQTTGVNICDFVLRTGHDEDRDHCVTLSPITSRGEVSEACRVSVARSAIPELIAVLQQILDAKP